MASTAASSADLKDYHRVLRRKLRRLKIPQDAVKELGVELGHGAFAKVRLLEAFGIRCAGKRLHDILFQDASRDIATGLIDRFAEECVRLGELRHPNIVQLIGVTFDEKSLTLVMEYLPTTLTDFLEGYDNIPDFTKASILLDVGYGMLFLHQQDPPVVHRDLSTNNVLLTRELQAKISDLGVAKRLAQDESGLVELMSLCPGTQLFMPPEARTGSLKDPSRAEYDTKMDCFSFGNIIIQVIVQKWLEFLLDIDPEDPGRPLKNEVKRRSLYLDEMADHMLHDLAVKCLQDNPAERPSSHEIVRKLKMFKEDNPPPFKNSVEMWSAYLDASNHLRDLESEVGGLKSLNSDGGDGAPCSFEKLRIRVRGLEEELMEKNKEILRGKSEIAGYKSSIVSLKKMLSAATSQEQLNGELRREQLNGELPSSPERQQHATPSPVPPTREKRKQPPPKPPRPLVFSMSSSSSLSSPPSPPHGSPPLISGPTTRPRAGTDSSVLERTSHRRVVSEDLCYSDLPGFPDPYSEIEPRALVGKIRSQPTVSSDDTIEITSPPNIRPQPRPRADTDDAKVQPKPRRPRNMSAPTPPGELARALPPGPAPPHKPNRKGNLLPTPTEASEELSGAEKACKSSIPESLAGSHRNKPLPPIPKGKRTASQPALQSIQDMAHYETEEIAGIYEIPIPAPSIVLAGRRKQTQTQDIYEEITPELSLHYEVPLQPSASKPVSRSPEQAKADRPPPPPKPYSGKRPPHGIPKMAMLPHSGAQDSQLQKLLARQQQKAMDGTAGDKFQSLDKQRSQPLISAEHLEVDPTLKRKLEKRKEKIKTKR